MKSSRLIVALAVSAGVLTPAAAGALTLPQLSLPINSQRSPLSSSGGGGLGGLLGGLLGGGSTPTPTPTPTTPTPTPTPTAPSTPTPTPTPTTPTPTPTPTTPTPTPTPTTPTSPPAGVDTTLDNPVRLVRMEMHLTTTSDWTNLTISQGYMADTRLISQSGDGTWTLQTAGLSLGGGDTTGGTKTYTVDMLYTDTDETQPFDFNLTKGLDGTSTVTFTNLDTGAVVAQLSDTDKTTTTQTHPVSTEVTRAAFMGTSHSVLPRVDTRKLVLSFYYPWYTTYQDAGLAEQPSDPRSTYDQAGVTSMTAQAKANGVDGFVVSWSGAAIDDTQMGLAVNAADTEGQVITGYIESAMSGGSYGSPSEARELSWITQLLKYSSNSAFLKTSAGVPIVFVYKMDELTAAQWQDLLSQLKTVYGEQVALVGDDPDAAYLPYEYGVHNYGAVDTQANLTAYSFNTSLGLKEHAALYGGTSPLFVGTASPGYDDQALRGNQNPVVPRNGGTRYVQTWDAALAGEPDWMLVTSWNEWFEDTAIEPGTASGDAALGITGTESATWKATS